MADWRKVMFSDESTFRLVRGPGVDLGWWGPWGKQRGGGPFVVVRKKISVKSDVFKTRQIWINFLLYNC